jgi:hypothetical protein
VSADICLDTNLSVGDGTLPLCVGEWSIETAAHNKFANRRKKLNTGLYAFANYTRGSFYWTVKFSRNVPVAGEVSKATTGIAQLSLIWVSLSLMKAHTTATKNMFEETSPGQVYHVV